MILNKLVIPEGGVIHASVALADVVRPLTSAEISALREAGDPVIELGGTITHSPSNYTLPAQSAVFPTHLPFKQTFDTADDVLAESKAVAWVNQIVTRITTEMQNKREAAALLSDTAGDNIVTIDTTP